MYLSPETYYAIIVLCFDSQSIHGKLLNIMAGEDYIKIRINSIHQTIATTFDVFVQLNNRHVLYLRAGATLTKEKVEKFEKLNADVFYIKSDDRQNYKDYVHDCLNRGELKTKEKAIILKESTFSLVEELFETPDVQVAMNESRDVVNNIVDFLQTEDEAVTQMIGLSSHDFYTYNHSLDVSIYCVGLAQKLGYNDEKELQEIGMGGLLHDIGKRYVRTEVITKKGGLDEDEWEEMKQHPVFGLKVLSENANMTDNIKACCFEHHENFSGGGYPRDLTGQDIHPMARICAVADCYDALTTKRSYSEPMSPSAALSLMKDRLHKKFDPDFFKAMHEILFKMEL
jgi:HD-GYP domain-containing protein (c-di-GMP phosphodiesterase class II)